MLRTALTASLATLALATALTSTALAQAIPATVDSPVEITFYNYNLASAGIGADGTKKLIAEFEAANPNVKVNGIGVPANEMASRIQADLAAGNGPDIAQVVFQDLDYVAHNMGAVALEDIVPAEEMVAHFEGMSPNGLKLGVIDGKTWALAYTFSTPVLFYNADVFKEAGLDPDNPPKNWAEVQAAAQTVADKTGKKGFDACMLGAGGGASDWMLQSLLLSNGARTMSEDRKTLTFAEPKAVEAVTMLRAMADAGLYENNAMNTSLENMATSNAAMFLCTSALQSALIAGAKDKYELRNTMEPGFGDVLAVPTNSGSGLSILSKDPLKQRAAWELTKFLTSKRGYTIITSEIGYLPLRTDIVNDPQYLGQWVKDHPLVQPNLQQLDRLQPWVPYPGPNYRQIHKTMMEAMEMAVWGGVDVAQTLKAAQDQARAMMPN
jgi:multiple sugar transport system substrate-binding protein